MLFIPGVLVGDPVSAARSGSTDLAGVSTKEPPALCGDLLGALPDAGVLLGALPDAGVLLGALPDAGVAAPGVLLPGLAELALAVPAGVGAAAAGVGAAAAGVGAAAAGVGAADTGADVGREVGCAEGGKDIPPVPAPLGDPTPDVEGPTPASRSTSAVSSSILGDLLPTGASCTSTWGGAWV